MTWWSKHRRSSLGLATLVIILSLLWSSPVRAFGGEHQKILLRDVQTLTLHRGRMTTGRRAAPVPQVTCAGGNACGDYEPDVVQCTNAGFDGSDVQWKCQADLPDNLRFGELSVYCEGSNEASGSGSGPHGGGGGGGGGWGSGWGSGWDSNNDRHKPTGEGFRPGFWSGLGVGGLATYLATNRNRQQNYRPAYASSTASETPYSRHSTPHGSYSGGWGAGPSSSSASSSSNPTRSATGFGGTRRR
ncbi:hypothetical protein EDD11_001833 [Mortierella claussenii]|nr:hypothetical protein EDD11_001833 [Mortierella claussenii]